jgi:hypothetical protein
VQLSIGPRKVMLADPNCRYDQGQARYADVHRVPVERWQAAGTIRTHARIGQTQGKSHTRSHTLRSPPIANETA